MSFEVQYAVIHSFTKEANTTVLKGMVKKIKTINVALPAVVALVKGVNGLLGKTGNILSYGQFGDDMREGPFPSRFDGYQTAKPSNASFLALSHVAVDELAKEAAEEPFATGGHILVAAYTSEGRPFFLVAMIKQRGGIQLDKDYVPIEITEVDLSKVYQAARISVKRYLDVKVMAPEVIADDKIPEDRTYLAFLGQGTHNQASGYFVKALGCTKGIGSSRATQNALDAVHEFFARADLKPFRLAARNAVASYLDGKEKSGQNAILTELAFCATGHLKASQEIVIEDFKSYLNSDLAKVPAAFAVHKGTLKKGTRIKAEMPSYSFQFERQSLGESNNSAVFFNAKNKSITFNNLDEKTIKEINAELELRK
jgi:nucleoid-associated protein